MSRLNPKPKIALSEQQGWEQSWPSLDSINGPALSSETLKMAFKAKHAETQRLYHRLHRLIKNLPLPALLYNHKGRIVMANHEARVLVTGIDWKKTKWQVKDLWEFLGWPAVPFTLWEWKGGKLSCWDCPLDEPGQPSLTIRYLKFAPASREGVLEHAHRMAAIGEKACRLAHDIRNPLASIEWFATLLGREETSTLERRDLAGHVIQAIRSLDGLISNLLLFSTPMPDQRQPVNLTALLDDVELLALYPLRKKRLIISRHRDSGLQELTGNEQLLKQALLNLLLNAIHASSPEGTIDIHCRRTRQPRTGEANCSGVNSVIISIRDEGCGMSEEELKQVFQPFYSKRKGGTGLGLPIVKDIVQTHEGKIQIISHKGKGTTVELVFPQ
jgi:nitrogen-specific signal transduction histidine kinase